jgi:ABC-type transport system involved in multi-copper enzyme maturation permease subunit
MILYQLRGMLWYELVMHWRRGWLRIVLFAFVAAPVFITVLARETLSQTPGAHIVSVTNLAIYTTTLLWPIIFVVIPLLSADVIPVDRQYNTRDMLDSLPLARTTYLMGKLLGVWSGILIAMIGGSIVNSSAVHTLISPFNPGLWLAVWFGGLGFFALLFPSISILMSAGRPSRRQAVALSFALSVLYGYGFVGSSLFLFYKAVFGNIDGETNLLPPILSVHDLIIGVIVFMVVFLFAWGTLQSQDRRA